MVPKASCRWSEANSLKGEECVMTKKTWQEPSIESEPAFETLVYTCLHVNENGSVDCGLQPGSG
jgi:hypothetical protein